MNEYVTHNKSSLFHVADVILIVMVVVILTVALVTAFMPRAEATVAHVYVDGKLVRDLRYDDDYSPVATYNGVLVRVSDRYVETVYRDRVSRVSGKGGKLIYPTEGVVVEVD